ncbi:DedA family protein [Aldersonia kunmingensis]|uniref:DedA family protein n=1 Tax=Aldersonia kunmingensis TaxID=408066 RepID=UPI00082F9EFF|nr:DedA family protein [Aldersonia kunmingensis]
MTNIIEKILDIPAAWVYVVVGLLVFAEDAIFIGFVIPGETAAVIGGVAASQDHVSYPLILAVVIAAAIAGDSVGYEIGTRFGPRMLEVRFMAKRADEIDKARAFLAKRGGSAVFLGRFVAFFRAVMPGLAGMSNMHYRKFLLYNAIGGVVWGTIFVTIGFVAGNSYERVAKAVGRDMAIIVVALLVLALIGWRVRHHILKRRERQAHEAEAAGDDSPAVPAPED